MNKMKEKQAYPFEKPSRPQMYVARGPIKEDQDIVSK